MDDRRFDALVKSLATGRSRRAVLKGLLGLGGAALGCGVRCSNRKRKRRGVRPRPPNRSRALANRCCRVGCAFARRGCRNAIPAADPTAVTIRFSGCSRAARTIPRTASAATTPVATASAMAKNSAVPTHVPGARLPRNAARSICRIAAAPMAAAQRPVAIRPRGSPVAKGIRQSAAPTTSAFQPVAAAPGTIVRAVRAAKTTSVWTTGLTARAE